MSGATFHFLPDAPLSRRPASRAVHARQLPDARRDWAYFLDFDGTLVEIASQPDGVRADHRLRTLLDDLLHATNGAVALVTGRAISEVDTLLGMPHIAVAGQHGAERRDASGGETSRARALSSAGAELTRARAELHRIAERHPLLRLEDKGLSLAMHYRNAPSLASFVHRTVHTLQRQLGGAFEVQTGKRVIELKPAGFTKGDAVLAFMHESPFRGRLPVFVGDDSTDEHGFAVVNQSGGVSIKVGHGRSVATHRLPTVEAVHAWLQRATSAPDGMAPSPRSR